MQNNKEGANNGRRAWGGAAALAFVFLATLTVNASAPVGESIRLTPQSLNVAPARSLPLEVQQLEIATAQRLFDRDTTTDYTAFDATRLLVALEAATDIEAIKVHGPAPYRLSVLAERAGSWEPITGLEDLDLTRLSAAWHQFSARETVTSARLRLDLTPAAGGAATALSELEIWGRGRRVGSLEPTTLLASATPGQPAQARAYEATPREGVIGPLTGAIPDDASDNRFTLNLPWSPHAYTRAWLVYDVYGLSHWAHAVRQINGQTARGGWALARAAAWSTQIEPLNPAWLKEGTNHVDFAVASAESETYTVKNVKLLVELDNGANAVRVVAASPEAPGSNAAAAYDADFASGWRPYPSGLAALASAPEYTLHLARPAELSAVEAYLVNALRGTVRVSFLKDGAWVDAATAPIEGRTLTTGWNRLPAASPGAVDAVKLLFEGGLGSAAEIKELAALGSGIGPREGTPRLNVTYPTRGEYVGRRAYLRGYLTPPADAIGAATITVGKTSVTPADGAFEFVLSKDDVGFADQADPEPWSVTLTATYPAAKGANAVTVTTTVTLDRYSPPLASSEVPPAYSSTLPPGIAKKLNYDGVTLDINSKAVGHLVTIGITPLKHEDLPALDTGMVNVTQGPRRGYRFTPHGNKFKDKIAITMPYDPALIPAGLGERDIRTYYFDDQAGAWKALERVSVDTRAHTVTSYTDHFTDMINAVVTVPDHPQALSFNPTSMKDIKAADPGAQVNLIEPPRANNQGDARLSYPIEVPPGRQGLQPQLAVSYNSSGGNGWMGLGWDLATESISIDTRWGVPRYDMGEMDGTPRETETYLLNGEQLTPVAHRADPTPRNLSGTKTFHTRVEGQFRRILRHGNSPSTYWWEVIDKNGMRSIYGGNLTAGSQHAHSVLADPNTGNVYKWMLREMRDPHGNTVLYHYDVVTHALAGQEPWRQIYPRRITYTGTNGSDGPYELIFHRAGGRTDVTIDARGGFKTVLDQRLTGIDVNLKTHPNPRIRHYVFEYDANPYGDNRPGTAFSKTLLTKISQLGEEGETPFNEHRFTYHDDVRDQGGAYNGFAAAASWNTGNDRLAKSFLGVDASLSVLGGNVGKSRNSDRYKGVGPISPGNKGTSLGRKTGSSSGENDGVVAFADVNGDGLPDKIFRCDQANNAPPACGQSAFVYRPNKSGPAIDATTTFGEAEPLRGLPAISREQSKDSFKGTEGYVAGLSGLRSTTKSMITQSAYFADVNGDGLTDIVFNNTVRFNRLVDGKPEFGFDSTVTPVPIDQGQPIDADGTLPSLAALQNELITDHPLMDAVRRWVAPFNGEIEITGEVQLIDASATDPARADYTTADGVRVVIQRNQTEVSPPTILTDYTPVNLGPTTLSVSKGDRIYFRVQSRFDGAYDDVRWNPQITYVGQSASTLDVNRLPLYRYRASESFIYGGRSSAVRLPFSGTVRLLGELSKTAATTDDVTLAVYLLTAAEMSSIADLNLVPNLKTPALARTLTQDQIGTISLAPGADDLTVQEGQHVLLLVQTDSPIDLGAISWQPRLVYVEAFAPSSAATDADGNPVDIGVTPGAPLRVQDEQGEFIIKIDPIYDIDLYPTNDLSAPQSAWTSPAKGTLSVVPQISTAADDTTTNSTLVVTVKRKGATTSERIGKQTVTITGGAVSAPPFTVSVEKDDELYFDISTRDAGVAARLTSATVAVTFGDPATAPLDPVPSAFHRADIAQAFPESYRGWSYFAYNGNDSCEQKKALGDTSPCLEPPINENKLVLSQSDEPAANSVYPAFARARDERWVSEDDRWEIRGDRVSASRHGLDDVSVPLSSDFAAAPAVPRISSNNQTVTGGGFYVTVSDADSDSTALLDFMDMNGDRYPDVVSAQDFVQFTLPTGRLEDRKKTVNAGGIRTTKSDGDTIGGPAALPTLPRSGKSDNKTDNQQQQTKPESQSPSFSLSASLGEVENESTNMLLDINGDGLPDRVTENNGALSVRLNLGYRFAAQPEFWGFANLSKGRNENASLSAGYSDIWRGFSGGANVSASRSETLKLLSDLNGDGLPDALFNSDGKLKVAFNTGSGFLDAVDWSNDRKLGDGKGFTLGGGGSYEIDIRIPLAGIVIVINPAASTGRSASRTESMFQDIDGDGYIDHLAAEHDDAVEVRTNRTGRTNLLKKIHRPLGATIDLAYTRDGNTFDLPQSRWLLTRVAVFDGHVGAGADHQVTTYRYAAPKYNRRERDFYGYTTVIEEQRDTEAPGTPVYRTVTREYLTGGFYTKGLLKREVLEDAHGNPFTETEHTYVLRDVDTGAEPANGASTAATIFPKLTRTDRRFYEGNVSPGKATYTTHEYDSLGNVVRFTDAGDVGAHDDVEALIAYTSCEPAYIVKPQAITVRGAGQEMRRREADIDCTSGDVKQVRQYLETGQPAITDLGYFQNGNLRTVTGPANHAGQRYQLTYEYDPLLATHVTRITDSFGLSSQATHHYKYGKIETATDTNNNQTTYFYDSVGRLERIVGPYEQGEAQPTLAFAYAEVKTPTSEASGTTKPLTEVPWALTRHVDKDASGAYKPSGTIDTILFTDGLKRVLQTKKDATVLEDGSSAAQDKMIVSGHVRFDAFGRTVAQHYPSTETKGANTAYHGSPDTEVPPTTMAYDVLDRNVRTTLPDASFTTIAYGFGQDRGGLTQFETTVRDGNVNAGQPGAIKSTYRDVRELITGVKELNQGSVLWTSYAYDALKQIAKVVDDKFNTTTVAYDHLGRRTAIDNPDTGKTETHYDLAGNLTRRITANLRAAGQAIAYAYDFNRLKSITYPVNTGNNITYTYGAPGSPGNAAGRLTRITSQMGTEERAYGKLGEVVYEKKTVVTFTTPNAPEVYETRYRYDPFGRLLKLTYPDGEVLTYAYDSGGNLKSAEGVKGSPASGGTYRYGYLKNLSYDKFESRVLLEAGNSVKTAYKYDPKTRRLANLTAGKGAGNLFQNLLYTYDLVGNVLGLANDVPVPPPSQYGGPTTQTFAYDELYRLTKAQGTYQYAPNKTHTYSLDLAYDTIHNLTQKTQVHYLTQPSGVPIPQKKTSYDWAYTYSPSGPNSVRPHAPIHIGERTFGYDLNGNQLGWTHDQNGTRRTIVWDEENRIQSLFDSGHEKTYKYDDQGNRVIKRGPQGETVYVNQFYTQRPGATGTKNVYAGTTRLTSKLVKQETPGSNPAGKTPYEKDLYFYHPDHLGTSNYITDTNGRLYEHLEYFPFGEAWVEENSNTQRTPYLFTAKELDEETGLYYFGARYYDPRTSVWQSADPILNQYLDGKRGMGGVFAPQNLALYSYTWNNPVKYADPDGKAIWVPIFIGIGLYLSDVKPANAPGPSDVPTSESVSMAPQDLAVEAVKQVAPESTHTAIDVVSTVGNPKKAIQGAGDLVRNVSSGPLKTKSGNVEAAASAARTQPHNTPVLTEHAKKRMEQRGVSQSRVEEAATHGDIVGNRGPVVERHMPASRSESGRGTTVTQDVRTNRVTTVIDKGSQD